MYLYMFHRLKKASAVYRTHIPMLLFSIFFVSIYSQTNSKFNFLFSSMTNAHQTQIVGLGFIVCLVLYPFKATDVLDQLALIRLSQWYVLYNWAYIGTGLVNYDWAYVLFCVGLQNSSLPFNKYAFLTTHNAFSIEGEPSHTGIPRITPTNQEDNITQQLNVCHFI